MAAAMLALLRRPGVTWIMEARDVGSADLYTAVGFQALWATGPAAPAIAASARCPVVLDWPVTTPEAAASIVRDPAASCGETPVYGWIDAARADASIDAAIRAGRAYCDRGAEAVVVPANRVIEFMRRWDGRAPVLAAPGTLPSCRDLMRAGVAGALIGAIEQIDARPPAGAPAGLGARKHCALLEMETSPPAAVNPYASIPPPPTTFVTMCNGRRPGLLTRGSDGRDYCCLDGRDRTDAVARLGSDCYRADGP
jgi:2-methylisocitrate lyase-like PEP mutase family enzyme